MNDIIQDAVIFLHLIKYSQRNVNMSQYMFFSSPLTFLHLLFIFVLCH